MFLTAIEDQPPQVEVALKGIGSRGHARRDDSRSRQDQRRLRQSHKTWFDIQVNESGDPRDVRSRWAKAARSSTQIDFRDERAEKTGLEIKPGDKLFLAVKAADKLLHLARASRTWPRATAIELDVVTPEELLAQLEVREIGLRRRFELIIDEMTQLRDSLLRVKASSAPGAPAGDPEDLRGDDDPDAKPLTPSKRRSGRPSCGCCACSGRCSKARSRWPKCWASLPASWTFAKS